MRQIAAGPRDLGTSPIFLPLREPQMADCSLLKALQEEAVQRLQLEHDLARFFSNRTWNMSRLL